MAERDAQIRALQDFAIGFGVVAGAAHSETADQIRVWVRAQEQQRETLARKRELVARLDQVTGGRNLTELQAELTKLMDSAGPEPTRPPPMSSSSERKSYSGTTWCSNELSS